MNNTINSHPDDGAWPVSLSLWRQGLARWISTVNPVKLRKPNERKACQIAHCAGLALALAVNPAQAGNILVNTNFAENSGQAVAMGWNYFEPPTVPASTEDYWIGGPATAPGFHATPLSGSNYWKEWGAGYFQAPTNNVAGIYQEFDSSAGSVYQACGWFYTPSMDTLGSNCYVWIDVSFLDAGGNLLALYTSADFSAPVGEDAWFQYQVTNACDLSSPVDTGDPYFTNYAVAGPVTQLVAPAGTTTVRYRFAYLQAGNEGGSCYFDNPELDQSASFNALPFVTIQGPAMPSQNSFTLSWTAQAGGTYQVEYSPDLVTWFASPTGEVVATGLTASWTDSGPPGTTSLPFSATQRFYRVFQFGFP
jgi:hypothetical protein